MAKLSILLILLFPSFAGPKKQVLDMDIQNLRQDYSGRELTEKLCPAEPFELFRAWFREAVETGAADMNAMVLSTASSAGIPSARVVLLKELDHGFVWFSNYGSAKASDLAENHHASLTFWWDAFSRQVRVQGRAEKVTEAESNAYFLSRPRGSRAGAIASSQSSIIQGREDLEKRYSELLSLPDEALTRPDGWGGYRLIPDYLEFWQGRESRLHDRIFYRKSAADWTMGRLSP
jgi:pyridoxamine 5'-phosphate oxidase